MEAWISELLTTVEGVKTVMATEESACIADDLIAQDQSGSEKLGDNAHKGRPEPYYST